MKLERTPTSSGVKFFSREGSTFLPPLRRDGNTKAANKANQADKAANATNNMKPIKIAIQSLVPPMTRAPTKAMTIRTKKKTTWIRSDASPYEGTESLSLIYINSLP